MSQILAAANAIGALINETNKTVQSGTKTTCPLCHDKEFCLFDAFPLFTEEGIKVCQVCSHFVNHANENAGYVKDAKKQAEQMKVNSLVIPADKIACLSIEAVKETHQIGFEQGLHAILPESHYYFRGCNITSFFLTVGSFIERPALGVEPTTYPADMDQKQKDKISEFATQTLYCSLRNQNKTGYSTFTSYKDGTILGHAELQITDKLLFKFQYKFRFTRHAGLFVLNAYSVGKPTDFEVDGVPRLFHTFYMNSQKQITECLVHGHEETPVSSFEVVDELSIAWQSQDAEEELRKEAKKEQKRKEHERKEKKEREREEMRQYAIQQKEKEEALRLARASLVSAVAKVDEQLETIRKLRELNREVAIKNQKLADRKEADRLAKEAEKRHADKLKQKELERLKFISKKN